MVNSSGLETGVIFDKTEWIDASEVQIRARKVGDSDRIMVYVRESTYDGGSIGPVRAMIAAEESLERRRTTAPLGFLFDFSTDRKVSDFEGVQHSLKIRTMAFLFRELNPYPRTEFEIRQFRDGYDVR